MDNGYNENKTKDSLSCVVMEQELLGAMIVVPDHIPNVISKMKAQDFYCPCNMGVYEAIQNLNENEQPVTIETINFILKGQEKYSALVDSNYIYKLTETVQSATVEVLVQFLCELSQKRNIGDELVKSYECLGNNRACRAEDFASQTSEKIFSMVTEPKNKAVVTLDKNLSHMIEHLHKLQQKEIPLLTTGFIDLDRKIIGFSPADLIILAGRPAMGKTAFALNLAKNVAKRSVTSMGSSGGAVALISLEMTCEQLMTRLIAGEAEIETQTLRSGEFSKDFLEQTIVPNVERLKKLPIFIDDSVFTSFESLEASALKLKKQHNISLLIIDYLQLLQLGTDGKPKNRYEEISTITRQLKKLARKLDIPIVLLSQLSRAVEYREDKHPMLADLRDSGSIEQDADLVLFIYRDEYYLERDQPSDKATEEYIKWQTRYDEAKGKAEIIVSKQRQGPTGRVVLGFDSRFTAFRNFTDLLADMN